MDTSNAISDMMQYGDRSTWFVLQRKEWTDYARKNADKFPDIPPTHVFAKKVFNEAFVSVIRRNDPTRTPVSIPEYAKVLEWALNNDRKGLFLIGDCGTGKTAVIEALWLIFAQGNAMWFDNQKQKFFAEAKFFSKYNATELSDYARLEEALAHRMIMIDDIGTEAEVAVSYGQRRSPIAEIVDNAEKKNGLLIMTSNLTPRQLGERYGERTLDRLNALCRIIQFKGNSFRK